ncbi:MAG: DUF342 domain-containing protein [Sedimentisphaerales bacterium]|nr:DUF342 domain-containing protein [Sedimentisphaerales bacterium]
MPPLVNNQMYVKVSDDRMEAVLELKGGAPEAAPTVSTVIEEIDKLGLALDHEEINPLIEKFVAELEKGTVPQPVVIARGKPPVHDEHGKLEKLYEKEKTDETQSTESADSTESTESTDSTEPAETAATEHQSHYERSSIIAVTKGDALLKIIPPVSGEDGMDVYGKVVPHKLGREVRVVLGKNVTRQGDTVYAAESGKVDLNGDKISIETKLEVNGNVDFSIGNIKFPGEVVICKNVLDLFKVHGDDCVTVQGVIEAAEVHANKILHAVGGMAGKEKGKFSAGEKITSKYITNAEVKCGGDVQVMTEIVNCNLVCDGKVMVERGPLVGGHIVARGGVEVKDLGSEAGIKTLLEVGADDALRRRVLEVAPEVKQKRAKIEKVRSIVEPLLANQKHLTNDQKEKATELLYTASELEDSVNALIEEISQAYAASQEKVVAEVRINERAYPGVTIRFPHLEVRITKELRGPVLIHCKGLGRKMQVVVQSQSGGNEHTLPSSSNCDEAYELLNELLASKPVSEATV